MSKQNAQKDKLELNKQTLKDLPVDGSDVAGGAGIIAVKPGQERMTGTSVIAPTIAQTGGTSVIMPNGH